MLSVVPGWVWWVVGAVVGMGLGLLLGGLRLRNGKKRAAAKPTLARGANTTLMASTSTLTGGAPTAPPPVNSQFSGRTETPQQRLLERLRESNLDLSAQLRASAAQHARLLKEKEDEVGALKADYDQRVEELRQTHSSELKYLMALLVEQVDSIHKSHANHVRALEAEMDRLRHEPRPKVSVADSADTTTFAMTEAMDVPPARRH